MILVVDKTSTSTVHIPNNGKQAEDYVTAGLYEFEIGKINTKLDNYGNFDELAEREQIYSELNNLKDLIM